MHARTTQQVFDHHLQAFAQGLEALVSDYGEQSCIILQDSTIHGLEGIRRFFDGFLQGAEPAFWQAFQVLRQDVVGEVAYLAWEARPFIARATDTLLVRDGRILVQTFTALG